MKDFLLKIRGRLHYGDDMYPARDWYVLLVVMSAALVISALWNAWLFHRVQNGGIFSTGAAPTASIFNKASVDAVNKVFVDRAAEETKYEKGEYIFTDPSR